ncbi:MAG: hypothetical protein KKH52_03910 [Nanoarchaeota archaeon]|nr:hypothetical protein [Nanoarchaeota archaeon]MBU1622215.1 hypothetical protein [Nanoarchaeota archaeon]MBU1974514.1 hypothetical protein [Nanoarchaeota archaeon]
MIKMKVDRTDERRYIESLKYLDRENSELVALAKEEWVTVYKYMYEYSMNLSNVRVITADEGSRLEYDLGGSWSTAEGLERTLKEKKPMVKEQPSQKSNYWLILQQTKRP